MWKKNRTFGEDGYYTVLEHQEVLTVEQL